MKRLAILGFHKIGDAPADWDSWFYIPERTFAGYLSCLRDEGWPVIDLGAFLRGLTAPESLPERSALLTFDDGYRSIREIALPWLVRFGYPGVMFVPSDFIGRFNSFDGGNEPEEPICAWDDLRELKRWGVTIQSHAASHRAFSGLHRSEQEAEVASSKAVLEAGLGTPVEVFAYPYGDCGPDPSLSTMMLERAGYRAACLYGGGPTLVPISDPYQLGRIAMGPDTDLQAELRDDCR